MELLQINPNMTKKEKKRVWAANGKRREIIDEWESWKYLIIDDLKNGKSIESKIQACIVGIGKFGMSEERAKKYIEDQLKRLKEEDYVKRI